MAEKSLIKTDELVKYLLKLRRHLHEMKPERLQLKTKVLN